MGHANRQSYRGIKSCRMLWFRNGLRYLRILACPATGTRPSSGHGPNNRDLKHRAGIRSILTSGWLRRVSSRYPYHAQCTNSCRENGAHTAAQCQCQSSGARNSKDLCNEHISNFIGFEVTRVESAYEVDHLGQPFYDKSVAYCDSCPHKPQNDIILQHSKYVPKSVKHERCPERCRCFVTKGEQVVFRRVNDALFPPNPGIQLRQSANGSRCTAHQLPSLSNSHKPEDYRRYKTNNEGQRIKSPCSR